MTRSSTPTPLRPGAFGAAQALFTRPRRRGDPVHEQVEALIGPAVSIDGDVTFAGGLRIDGHVTGDVTVTGTDAGTLTIGDQGRIDGHVRVSHVVVWGRVHGTVHATGHVDIRGQAAVVGDVHYGSIEVEAGTRIAGRLIRHPQDTM